MRRSLRKYGVVSLVFVLAAAVTFLLLRYQELQVDTFPISFKVAPYVGIGETTERDVFFGSIPPGAKGKKMMLFENNSSRTRWVHLRASGNFDDWLEFSVNNFRLVPLSNRSVELLMAVPDDAEEGNYTGVLWVEYW